MRIHHLAFRTRDLAGLEAFYLALGFESARTQPGYSVWLRSGDAVLMLEQAEDAEPSPTPGSRELVAFRVSSAERERVRSVLATRGITLEDETEHTLYFRDPDGRRIGVSSYPLD